MTFNNLYWFVLIPILAVGIWAVLRVGRALYEKRLNRFIAPHLRGLLVETDQRAKRRTQVILFSLMMIFLVVSLARPLLKEREDKVKREGVDFMVALDLSRSMLVRDVSPDSDRLASAKRVLRELMEKKLSGDNLGLIAFAGESRMLSPMTMNYDTLNLILDGLTTESLWPGSDMGKAITMAAAKMSRNELETPVLVIISDGESLDGDAVMAAREAKVKYGMTIFTVGVGTSAGGKIVMSNRDASGNVLQVKYLKDQNGEEVVSKINEQSLRTIAQVSGGSYVRLGSWDRNSDELSALCDLYEAEIKPLAKSLRIARVVSHVEAFQVPLAMAVLLLIAQIVFVERRKPVIKAGKAASFLLIGLICFGALDAQARANSKWAKGAGEWSGEKLFIPHSEKQMVIDGSFSEWNKIKPMPLPYMKKDASSVKLVWTEAGLYGAVRWDTGQVTVDKKKPWEAYSFELFVEKDNQLDHEVADYDPEVEHYIFFPEQVAQGVTNQTGPAYWMIPTGINRTDESQLSQVEGDDTILSAFSKNKWNTMVEFYIPASFLDPAMMEGWEKMTVHFSVNGKGGWPAELFAVDHTVNDAYRRPVTWSTVTLAPTEAEKRALAAEISAQGAKGVESKPVPTDVVQKENPKKKSVQERVALLSKTEKMVRKGDAKGAFDLLQKHLMNWPEDPFFLYNYGVAAYAAGNLSVAEASWSKVAMKNVSPLRNMTFFQLGNVFFRQAFELTSSQQNWSRALMLYHQAGENYAQISDCGDSRLEESVRKNQTETKRLIGEVYLARGTFHLAEALKEKTVIGSLEGRKAWMKDDSIRELLKEAGKAKTDFLELLALFPGHTSATKAMASVNELLEYGLLTKARSLKKEVDEVGSAQNEVWTVQKYQESISCYDQVLMMNSNNVAASEEKARVKEACRDLYISEAHIERTMAKNVLKERETEKELKRQIAIEKELGGREHLANLGQLEKNLRNVERRYPSSDPEKAVEHWENANDDYKIALTFAPDDPQVKTLQAELFDVIFAFRKEIADQYVEETLTMPFTNDEEADALVGKLESAVSHLKRAQEMKPSEAEEIRVQESVVKKTLARSYMRRAELYIGLGEAKKVEHLDRAVAYYEKAVQDYTFALQSDPSLESIEDARKATKAELSGMRISLSKRIAAMYEEEPESEEDMGAAQINESKLRELTLKKSGSSRTYKTIERPEPIFNW